MISSPDPVLLVPGRSREWPWVLALVIAGVTLSTLPHVINFAKRGDAGYVADGDGLLYLAWSRDVVRHGARSMTDAIHRPSGPMMHPWLLFVPLGWLTYKLGLGLAGLGVVWRVVAGAGLSIGLYGVVRPFVKTPRDSAGLSVFLLFDAGFLFGQIGQREGEIVASLIRGSSDLFSSVPRIMAHLRVPTPALAISVLLLHYTLAHRARRLGTVGSALMAGGSLGLLFHSYFYFATTLFAATTITCLLDRGGRKTYALMLGSGLIIASPALIVGAWIKSHTPSDWLHRTDKFVPIGHFGRTHLLLPRVLIGEWLIAGWFVWRTRRDLIYLWICVGSGLAMANHQLVTGMNLENFHWTYAYGVSASLLLPLLVLPWIARFPWWSFVATVLIFIQVGVGFGLRGLEVTYSAETNRIQEIWLRWRREGYVLPPRSIVAGPPELLFILGAMEDIDPLYCRLVQYSSAATDVELDERLVLNAILVGANRQTTINDGDHVSVTTRKRRQRLFDEIERTPRPWIDRFHINYLIIPINQSLPVFLANHAKREMTSELGELWRLVR